MAGGITATFEITSNRLPELSARGRAAAIRGVQAAVRRAREQAAPLTPVKTGALRGRVALSFRNGGLAGEARWQAPYAIFQELGTRRVIRPVRAKFLVFRGRDGRLVFAKQVRGVTGKHFARTGAERARPAFLADMRDAYRLGGR